MPLKEEISAHDLQEITGYSRQRIGQLVKSGVVSKIGRGVYPHPDAIRAIISNLGDVAAGRGGEEEQADLAKERALLAREQRVGYSLKNAAMRHDLVEASAVEREWASILSEIRGRMLALPTEFAQLLPHLTRHDIETVDRSVRDALDEASKGE